MGTFTQVSDVQSLFRRLKIEADTGDEETNTVVTTEEVNQWIDETEVMVKARLSTCYDVNNIGAESTTIIGVIVKYIVADIIRNVMSLTSGVNSERKDQMMGHSWAKMAKEKLEKICPEQECGECKQKPVMPLPDTPMIDSPPTGSALFSSSNNTPTFTKNGNNW